MALRIITTEDGSPSLFDDTLNETYHSTRGAIGESRHVYLNQGLAYYLNFNPAKEVRVLEVGLGTGLNAILTAKFATDRGQKICFTSLEPAALDPSIYRKLRYFSDQKEHQTFIAIHECEWEVSTAITEVFTLHKSREPLEKYHPETAFEVIYFDAFAPSKQSDIWSLDNLRKCFQMLSDDGVLTTYCAQGQFKRNLAEAGFVVETLNGAMGKKEMVRERHPS